MARSTTRHLEVVVLGSLVVACSPPPRGGGQIGVAEIADTAAAGSLVDEVRAQFQLPAASQEESTTFAALGDAVATSFSVQADGSVLPTFGAGTVLAAVTLPSAANGAVVLRDAASTMALRVTLSGATSSSLPTSSGGYLVYPGGYLGTVDIIHRPTLAGTEDFFYFTSRPNDEYLSYTIDLENVPGLRNVANTIELLDGSGTPRLRLSPPYLVGADGTQYWADVTLDGCGADHDPSGPWGRPVTAPQASSCTVTVSWEAKGVQYPALLDPSWGSTITMQNYRTVQTATLLSNARVLLAGGNGAGANCEFYNPSTGTFSPTGSLKTSTNSRFWAAAAASSGGHDVLIAGGQLGSSYDASAEVYCADCNCVYPGASCAGVGSWTTVQAMHHARAYLTATTLSGGKVLVTGGTDSSNTIQDTAELYDFSGNSWTVTNNMQAARSYHTATLLSGGSRVLIAGGENSGGVLSSAEVFVFDSGSPGSSSFTSTGAMNNQHYYHTAALLRGGTVLVSGGPNSSSQEVYTEGDFSSTWGSWTNYGNMSVTRYEHTAVSIPGAVLLAGGYTQGTGVQASTELFSDTQSTSASDTSNTTMNTSRDLHTATLLQDGVSVLVAGGSTTGGVTLNTGEVYTRILADHSTSCDATYPDLYCAFGKCSSGNKCCDSSCECGTCASNGTCSSPVYGAAGSPSCSPYLCNKTSLSCPTSCDDNTPCVGQGLTTGDYCSLGACVACGSTSAADTTYSFSANGDTTGTYPGLSIKAPGIKVGNFWGHIYPDIVEVQSSGVDIDAFEGTSTGISTTPTVQQSTQTDYGTLTGGTSGFWAVAVGDFNGDGVSDLAVAQRSSSYVYVMLANGSGKFTSHNEYLLNSTATNPVDIAAGDVNGDGKLDLVVAENTAGSGGISQIVTLTGNGDGTFTIKTPYNNIAYNGGLDKAAPPNRLVLADFDGDGRLDVAIGESGSNARSVWVQPGNDDGTFVTNTNQSSPPYALNLLETDWDSNGSDVAAIVAGDFNGDGLADIAFVDNTTIAPGNSPDREILLYTNSTTSHTAGLTFTSRTNPDSINPAGDSYIALLAADVDNDGKIDLVALQGPLGSNTAGTVRLHSKYSTSTNTFTHTTIASSGINDPRGIVYADFLQNDCKSVLDVVIGHAVYVSGVIDHYSLNDFVNNSN